MHTSYTHKFRYMYHKYYMYMCIMSNIWSQLFHPVRRDLVRFPVDRRLSWRCHKDAPWMSQSQSWGTSEIMGEAKGQLRSWWEPLFSFLGWMCCFCICYFWGCAVTSDFHVLLWIGLFFSMAYEVCISWRWFLFSVKLVHEGWFFDPLCL